MSSLPVIRLATTPEDRGRIFRFRYRIYVEEMGRPQKYADHQRRTVEEPFDQTAHLLMAEADGEVVGTVRTNFGSDTDLGYYTWLFGLDSVGAAFPGSVSLTTKLMIVPELRSSTLAVRLAMALYDLERDHGIRHDFIDCNAHLESFFTRLGYRRYRAHVEHPEYGRVLPLRGDLDDLAHLQSVGSPFVRSRTWKHVRLPRVPERLAA